MSKISDKLIRVLKDKKTVVTKAFFWKIPHDSGRIDIRLKVGRYKKPGDPFDPEVDFNIRELEINDEVLPRCVNDQSLYLEKVLV